MQLPHNECYEVVAGTGETQDMCMDDGIFLSVIIPVYNAEKYLPQCLESLLAAHIDDMELILIDDGSTDGSAQVINTFSVAHPYITLLSQQNSGPSAARNNGLSHAKGKYIAFIDADDYVKPKVFAQHIEWLRKSEADIWASDFERVADNGCVLDRVYQIKESALPITDKAYLGEFLAAKDCVWNVWRYIFSKDFLDINGLRFAEGYSIAEDLELVVRAISLQPELAFFHEPYYSYRVNYGASLTRIFSAEKIRQLMEMLKRAMGHLKDSDTDQIIKAKLAREYILNLSSLYEVQKAERPTVLSELKNSLALAEPTTGTYRYAAKMIKLFGISSAAWMLYMMKRLKRLLRGIKTKFFNRGQR